MRHRREGARRFTPARAGNTPGRPRLRNPLAVHPCAGREHTARAAGKGEKTGSPLRGQGTRAVLRRRVVPARFTPARAGNTITFGARGYAVTVHPCAGREHWKRRRPTPRSSGSPLRGQGTHPQPERRRPAGRFTPARAGNTGADSPGGGHRTVHPCAGREHPEWGGPVRVRGGSPLRGQGTRISGTPPPLVRRFTPARAGNTQFHECFRDFFSVHPCAGREHPITIINNNQQPGSPLRGQGTRRRPLSPPLYIRFTPARAGNTSQGIINEVLGAVHPCAGREHNAALCPMAACDGSPLRGQGTRLQRHTLSSRQRFTPARAGNTCPSPRTCRPSTVHPCAGREHG